MVRYIHHYSNKYSRGKKCESHFVNIFINKSNYIIDGEIMKLITQPMIMIISCLFGVKMPLVIITGYIDIEAD